MSLFPAIAPRDMRRSVIYERHIRTVESEVWVRKLSNHGIEAGNALKWSNKFAEGIPGVCVNPKFGTLLVWGRQERYSRRLNTRMLYYLVSLVRPVKTPSSASLASGMQTKKKRSGRPRRKTVKAVANEYYEMPVAIPLPGTSTWVDYVVIMNYVITNIIEPARDDDNTMLMDVKAHKGITTMTSAQFFEKMNAVPAVAESKGYAIAYDALCSTNPEFIAKYLPSTIKKVTPEASKYLFVPMVASSIGADVAVTRRCTFGPVKKRHIFHPEWYDPEEIKREKPLPSPDIVEGDEGSSSSEAL